LGLEWIWIGIYHCLPRQNIFLNEALTLAFNEAALGEQASNAACQFAIGWRRQPRQHGSQHR